MTFDPILLEILSNKTTAIAEEMALTLQRAGRTIYVKETEDFGTGLMSRGGEMFGYPQRTGVIGFMGLLAGEVLNQFNDLEPGDIILANDPYSTAGLATHLPDLNLIKPYYVDGELVCFGWSFIHSADIGGKVPSSISPSSTEIFQEGLRLPPVRLVRKGVLQEDIVSIYKANCRTSELNWGDVQAMVSSLNLGEKRIVELVQQYGLSTIIDAPEEILAYSQKRARQALRRIPDGRYEFTDYLDNDLIADLPVKLSVAMTVDEGMIELDFSASDLQTQGPLNLATGGFRHPWLVLRLVSLARSYTPDLMLNGGIFRNVAVKTRQGTIYHPSAPASVGIRFATGLRTYDAVNGAIAMAAPGLMPAASGGVAVPIVLVEPANKGEQSKVSVVQFMLGGTGARKDADGIDGIDPGMSSMANNPIEIVESEANISILDYGIQPDSGGPGRMRGGCGQRIVFEVHGEGCVMLARGIERVRFQPWGLQGGAPGTNFQIRHLHANGAVECLTSVDTLHLAQGDRIEICTPGGGGYGSALYRSPEAVLGDVVSGLVSPAAAAEHYGVVITEGRLNEAETRERRRQMKETWTPAEFSGGVQRSRWENGCPPELHNRLLDALFQLPDTRRAIERARSFAAVLSAEMAPADRQPDKTRLEAEITRLQTIDSISNI
jgi:N-methylhydantoinase B